MTAIHPLEISTSVQYLGQLKNLLVLLLLCAVARVGFVWEHLSLAGHNQDCKPQCRNQRANIMALFASFHLAQENTQPRPGQDRSMHLGVTIVRWSSCTVLRVAVCTAAQRVTGKGSSSPRCSQDPSRGNRLRAVPLHFCAMH